MEWVARRGRRADGKEQARRIPAGGCNEQATQPAALLPRALQGCCGFWRWPALLGLAEIAADIGYASPARTASRLGQHQNSQQRGPFQFFNSLLGDRYE